MHTFLGMACYSLENSGITFKNYIVVHVIKNSLTYSDGGTKHYYAHNSVIRYLGQKNKK